MAKIVIEDNIPTPRPFRAGDVVIGNSSGRAFIVMGIYDGCFKSFAPHLNVVLDGRPNSGYHLLNGSITLTNEEPS